MQEEVEQKTITLAISASKLTARTLKESINKYLSYRRQRKNKTALNKENKSVKPVGKQSVKELIGQNQGVKTIEIAKSEIRDFERVARKYGVDFAIRKETSGEKPRFLVFFKGRDEDAITAAFKEYASKSIRNRDKPSLLDNLREKIAQSRADPARAHRQELER